METFSKSISTLVKSIKQNHNKPKEERKRNYIFMEYIYLYMIESKIKKGPLDDHRVIVQQIQKIFKKEINDDEDYKFNIQFMDKILVNNKRNFSTKWLLTMDIKELCDKIDKIFVKTKDTNDINIVYVTWWGKVHDNGKTIKAHQIMNNKTNKYLHARVIIVVIMDNYIMWYGYDVSNYRPGTGVNRKDNFFVSWLKPGSKFETNPRYLKKWIWKTLHYDNTFLDVVHEKHNYYFNPCIKYKEGFELHCCDIASINSGFLIMLSFIENYKEIITIHKKFKSIKDKHWELQLPQKDFMQKNKSELDKNIRYAIKKIIEPTIQKYTNELWKEENDVMVFHDPDILTRTINDYNQELQKARHHKIQQNNNNNKSNHQNKKRKFECSNNDAKVKSKKRRRIIIKETRT